MSEYEIFICPQGGKVEVDMSCNGMIHIIVWNADGGRATIVLSKEDFNNYLTFLSAIDLNYTVRL